MIWSPAGQITQPPSDPRLACPKAWSTVRLADGGRHSLCRWLLIPGMQALFSLLIPLCSSCLLRCKGGPVTRTGAGGCFGQNAWDMPLPASAGAVSHWAGGCLSLTLDTFTAPVHEASPLIDTGVHVCTPRSWDARVRKGKREAGTCSTSGPGTRSYKPCSTAKR